MNADGTQIFVSYRREDAAGYAGWLAYCLEERFGRANVFRDVNTIEAGVDFMDQVARTLRQTDVVLWVIGPAWATITRPGSPEPRIASADDFVRIELEHALKQRLHVVPVLLDAAPMPSAGELPASLAPLAAINAHHMRDANWRGDFEALATLIERFVAERASGGKLVGRELLERARGGGSRPTWVGRQGGLRGTAFAEDLRTGRWSAQAYEIAFGGVAPSRNWFRMEDWMEAVERSISEREGGVG